MPGDKTGGGSWCVGLWLGCLNRAAGGWRRVFFVVSVCLFVRRYGWGWVGCGSGRVGSGRPEPGTHVACIRLVPLALLYLSSVAQGSLDSLPACWLAVLFADVGGGGGWGVCVLFVASPFFVGGW